MSSVYRVYAVSSSILGNPVLSIIDAYAFDSGVEIEVSNDLTITDEWFEQCVATGRLFLRRQCDMVATVVGSVHLLFAGKLPALRGWPPLDFDDIRDPETGDVAPEAAEFLERFVHTFEEWSPFGTVTVRTSPVSSVSYRTVGGSAEASSTER